MAKLATILETSANNEKTWEALPEVRCPRCKALLYKGTLHGAIKCRKCNFMLTQD